MTTIADRAGVERVVEAARGLAPTIRQAARDVEAGRRLPANLLDQLIAAGCFRVLLPRSHGGVGGDLLSAMRIGESLAQADGAVAWTVTIGMAAWCDVAGLPRETFDALYASGPDTILAGAIKPGGTATPVEGGYRVTGRWGFASGCEHASWLHATCIEDVGGAQPRPRTVLLARDDVRIEDTWDAVGLRGTGSHHFSVEDALVPAERTFLTFEARPCLDEPILRIPPPSLYSSQFAAVALGIAAGALEDILSVSGDRVRFLASSPVATSPLFHLELATADTELRAARSLLYDDAAVAWSAGTAAEEMPPEQRARIRATASWAVTRASAVVDTAYRAAGADAVYADSPLQRRVRDMRALMQHFLVRHDTMMTAGAILAGQDVDVPIF